LQKKKSRNEEKERENHHVLSHWDRKTRKEEGKYECMYYVSIKKTNKQTVHIYLCAMREGLRVDLHFCFRVYIKSLL